jgi:hypothetical protein
LAKEEAARREGHPHPPVFSVRVANKGLMLDAASRASREGRMLIVDPSTPLRAGSLKLKGENAVDPSTPLPSRLRSGLTASRVDRAGSLKLKGKGIKRVYPRVFCERVRNSLMAKGLDKHSFLKSAERHESKGFTFAHFLEKSGKSEKSEREAGTERGRGNTGGSWLTNMWNYSIDSQLCQVSNGTRVL